MCNGLEAIQMSSHRAVNKSNNSFTFTGQSGKARAYFMCKYILHYNFSPVASVVLHPTASLPEINVDFD